MQSFKIIQFLPNMKELLSHYDCVYNNLDCIKSLPDQNMQSAAKINGASSTLLNGECSGTLSARRTPRMTLIITVRLDFSQEERSIQTTQTIVNYQSQQDYTVLKRVFSFNRVIKTRSDRKRLLRSPLLSCSRKQLQQQLAQ